MSGENILELEVMDSFTRDDGDTWIVFFYGRYPMLRVSVKNGPLNRKPVTGDTLYVRPMQVLGFGGTSNPNAL